MLASPGQFDESKVHRGQPGNRGKFGPGGREPAPASADPRHPQTGQSRDEFRASAVDRAKAAGQSPEAVERIADAVSDRVFGPSPKTDEYRPEDEDLAVADREEAEQRVDDDREAAEQFRDGTVAEYAAKADATVADGTERMAAIRYEPDEEYGVVDAEHYLPGGERNPVEDGMTSREVAERFDDDRRAAAESLEGSLEQAHGEVDDVLGEVRGELKDHATDFRSEASDYLAYAHDRVAARAVVAEGRKAFAERSAAALGRAKVAARAAKTTLSRHHRDQTDGLRLMRLPDDVTTP